MICPVCKYEYEEFFGSNHDKSIMPPEGEFFAMQKSGHKMKRWGNHPVYSQHESTMLYACPKCGVAFIETPSMKKKEESK